MRAGDTFYPLSDVVSEHLWIVLTDPDEAGQVAMANITTRRLDSDDSCLLDVSDHPFVRWESAIAYEKARVAPANALEQFIIKGMLQSRQPCSTDLLERVQNGALASIFTPRGVKKSVRKQLGIDAPP